MYSRIDSEYLLTLKELVTTLPLLDKTDYLEVSIMKKTICMICSFMLAMCLVSVAMAAPFSLYVQCENTSNLTFTPSYAVKITKPGFLYVKHEVTGGSINYANLFHATKPNQWLLAQKWINPKSKVPIQGNTLKSGLYCGLAARGNTKHSEIDQVSNITLSGSYTGQ